MGLKVFAFGKEYVYNEKNGFLFQAAESKNNMITGGIGMSGELKLLQFLEDNCTYTTEQLAAMANLTEDEVRAAIAKNEADKVILGYKAIVDWERTEREAVTA